MYGSIWQRVLFMYPAITRTCPTETQNMREYAVLSGSLLMPIDTDGTRWLFVSMVGFSRNMIKSPY